MRPLFVLALMMLLSGCLQGEMAQPKPDDAKMESLFSDALNGTQDVQPQAPTSTTLRAHETTTTETTVTSTTRPTMHYTTTTVALTPGLTCLMVKDASGAADCMRASCPAGKRCRYVPGKFYGEGGSCACKSG
jgi:hypothetical protein